MSNKRILLSKEKIETYRKELNRLEKDLLRQDTSEKAVAWESFRDAAAYDVIVKTNRARVRKLKEILKKAKELPEKIASVQVVLGSWVEVENDEGKVSKYRLVHPLEAEPPKGLVSTESPLGKLLLGKREGELVDFNNRKVTIQSIS